MKHPTNREPVGNSTVLLVVVIVLAFISGALLVINKLLIAGSLLSSLALLCFFALYGFIIPKAHRLEITKKTINLYSYRRCKAYFWKQIVGIHLSNVKDEKGNQKQKIIIRMNNGFSTGISENQRAEFEVSIDPEVYGYEVQALYDRLIKEKPNEAY